VVPAQPLGKPHRSPRACIGNVYGVLSDLWYKNSVFYSLNVETFMDGNGDGCGDFEGLNRRLDYLESLGVDALWLAPFQPTPGREDGYDISDYYNVDRRFGSSGDFVDFVHEAEGRGIRVVIDLVVNHTSDQHPWFKQARSDRQAPYHDWYVWAGKRPRDWQSGMVFLTFDAETGAVAPEIVECTNGLGVFRGKTYGKRAA